VPLYVVATPIGNLEDVTLRALRILREADLIACEDTRRTRALLAHHGIATPTTSYFQHSELRKSAYLLGLLREGKSIALVTDAGTPGISDPGSLLVREARAAGIPVVPIPGPSAATAALSVSGLPSAGVIFEGFLSVKAGRRRRRLAELARLGSTVVLYESPHRVLATLRAIGEVFGQVEVLVARELTKQFEEIVSGTPSAHLERLSRAGPRGEFTIVIPSKSQGASAAPSELPHRSGCAGAAVQGEPEPRLRDRRSRRRRLSHEQ
jgi:16S rRNA (cytidine1402-2'-O)-methyltransferase